LGSALIFTPFWSAGAVDSVRLNPWVIVATTAGVAVSFLLGLSAAVKAQFAPPAMGRQTLIGQTGVVRQALSPAGIVHVAGEEWSAVAQDGESLPVGTAVRVLGVDGLRLKVARVAAPEAA
jgi:membrane-bound serine protease (ClpP class)